MVLVGGKPERVVECIKVILELVSEVCVHCLDCGELQLIYLITESRDFY